MKEAITKHLGQSWRTTLVSYILAALLAVHPLLDKAVDFSKRNEVILYSIKLLFAAGIAVLGKYTADSSQAKRLNTKGPTNDPQQPA